MKKWLKYLLLHPLLVLLLILLLLVGAVAFLALTDAGSKILLDNAQRFTPGLKLEGERGSLARGLQVDNLNWSNDSASVEATGVELENEVDIGTPSTLRINKLHADKVVVHIASTEDEKPAAREPFDLPTIVLPLNIDARQVSIDELEITTGSTPLTFRNVELGAYTRDGRLQVEKFRAQAYDAGGQADIALQGKMDLGKPHELDVTLEVDSDSKVWGVGTGKIQAGGELQAYTLDVEADWQYAEYPRYAASLKGEGTFDDLNIDSLLLDGGAGQVSASGKLGWKDGLNWQADLDGENVNPGVFAPEWPADLDVALTSRGTWDERQNIELDISKLKGSLRDYPVDVTGEGNWNGKLLVLNALDAKVGDNRLQASGSAADTLEVKFNLDAPRLGQLSPQISGSAKGEGVLRGQADASQLQLDIKSLTGKVEGYELKATGQLDWGDKKLAARDVVVQSGNNRLEVSGQATEPFDLSWKVDAKNLARAWKGLQGSLQGGGKLTGTLDALQVDADLKGSKLGYQDYRLNTLDLQVSQQGERYDISGVLKGLQIGENEIRTANIDGEGTLESHRVTAEVTHEDGRLELAASGGLQNGEKWEGTVSTLSLRDTPAGNWSMTQPVQLNASAQAFSSSDICLLNGNGARICTEPAWSQQQGAAASGDLRQVPLVMLRPFLPDNVDPKGVVNAKFSFEQRGGAPVANIGLRLPDSSVVIRDKKGKPEVISYSDTRADLVLNNRRLDLDALVRLTGYGQVSANGGVNLSPQDGNHTLDVNVKAEMPDINWLERFAPQVDDLKGAINGDLTLRGSVSRPDISGRAALSGGSLTLPETGADLQDISLVLAPQGTERINITGSLQAGDGRLEAVNSYLSLANLPQWEASVNLRGERLRLMDTHEVQALVSPDLNIIAKPADVVIKGTLRIPEAQVSLREIPAGASVRSDDVIIVGENGGAGQAKEGEVLVKDAPLSIHPDVTIELGDEVSLNGFGFDSRLNGRLRVLRTRQDIVAQGVLNIVDGVYEAYGQNLRIERGRLIFNGPLDNPGLDVRATRKIEDGDITVGIELAGTVNQPESALFSSPAQTQSDTLSYLLTGRAMSGVRGDQSSLLMSAITGLGVAGGESIAQQIGGGLGLDEVGLSTKNGDVQQSELALGKRLGPRLYVRYIVGLFDSLQRLAVTYEINKRLQLQAETGLQQSVDLIYKLDTNKGPLGP